ncbi:MAG: VWA domain-containing protein [Ruminococcus sp.]|nr:VWA domain-containing protein [Ruminococcus sp.]
MSTNFKNRKFAKYSSVALTCTLLSASLCSCAEGEKMNDSASYSSSYAEYNSQSSYSEYYEEVESAAESSEIYDEEFKPEPDGPSANEEYTEIIESGFKDPNAEPLSTFSADVDTASYANVRRLIEDGMAIPEGAVRIEEFLNYFDYDYPAPKGDELFSRYMEIADCPWNPQSKLLMVGVQAKEIETDEAPPSNLVFLIDSSGSMSDYNKLPLVQSAFSLLAENLTEYDRISIVTYANSSSTLIKGASGEEKDEILQALYSITANGSTNGEGGIMTAYDLAERYFIEGGNNRVIIATDGDLNVGASSQKELVELIEEKRDNGIYLSVLGFGTDNIKDSRLEALADNGDGNYSYIDSIEEAQRVLVSEMSGTLHTIAKDVKIQVEFNPSQVKSYRLIGYDNRLMDAHDFIDDTKDAGEVGAGHSVTALYEIQLADSDTMYDGIELEFADEHKNNFTPVAEKSSRTELCKLSVAYKDIDGSYAADESEYFSDLFGMEKYSEKPSDNMKLAASVAEFGMLLKDSEFKENSSYIQVINTVSELAMNNKKVSELYDLTKIALSLYE